MTKRFTTILLSLLAFGSSFAAIPGGYYDKAENKKGADLLKGLESCISSHKELSYGSLFSYYPQTDCYPGQNKIWDMYSTKLWPVGEKCGNYSKIGDCYNREHSVPKSWFNDATPMYSDLMHLYPTDGRVNGQRSNYPYGECAKGSYVASSNGISARGRLGASTYPGYSGTVFEPDDEFKGDFARTYFYMAACYNNRVSTWSSDNFGGTSYPVFSAWTVEMLLKWHHGDPVSKKETDRNEAVYALQGNRNPFIDHPELADHIWGDKKNDNWSATLGAPAAINTPADGSAFFVGLTTKGHSRTAEISVRSTNLTKDITVSATAPFSCDKSVITATEANNGTVLKITFAPGENKEYTGTLTLKSGDITNTVTLTGSAIDGLPVGEATRVTSTSFQANWTYVGGENDYTLEVSDREGKLSGYPILVDAKAESYVVRGLQPATEYTYTLYTASLSGNTVSVTTAEALPYIEFLFDGDLYFTGQPGTPTAAAEIIMAVENIDTEITLTIDAPFEVSVDKNEWSGILRLSPDENRFYLRMNSTSAGEFEGLLRAETDGYSTDATVIRGTATRESSFLEDFEPGAGINGYCDVFDGSAARWIIKNGGFWNADPAISGNASLRFVKSGDRFIAMDEDRTAGIGTVSFNAKKWDNSKDETAVVDVETSTDGGLTWQKQGTVEISSVESKSYSVHCGIIGKSRLRLTQTAGNRWLLDDISITDLGTGLEDPTAERHLWDAHTGDGRIIVEISGTESLEIAIYCIDGCLVFNGSLDRGTHSFEASRNQFYIIAANDSGRTVLVR